MTFLKGLSSGCVSDCSTHLFYCCVAVTQDKTRQGKTGQDKTGQDKTGQDKTRERERENERVRESGEKCSEI